MHRSMGLLFALSACARAAPAEQACPRLAPPREHSTAAPPAAASIVEPPVAAASVAPEAPPPPTAPRRKLIDDGLAEDAALPRGDGFALGLDGAALDRLIEAEEQAGPDAVVVVLDGKIVVERYFGRERRPIPLRSIAKSFTSMAIGMLIDEGKIAGVDAPLSTWLPELARDEKAHVTLRHVLSHTSGLAHEPSDRKMLAQKDTIRWAAALPLRETPGAVYAYSNEAVQLLSGVVRAASGQELDEYLRPRLFEPLGIRRWWWTRDRAQHCLAYAGVHIGARDLARVGVMLQNGGEWQGKRIVPRAWLQAATRPAATPHYGLLFSLYAEGPAVVASGAGIARLEQAGVAGASALAPLAGRRFATRRAFWLEAGALLDPPARAALADAASDGAWPFDPEPGARGGFGHGGSYGQWLIVHPAAKLVAVRQVAGSDPHRLPTEFDELVAALARSRR